MEPAEKPQAAPPTVVELLDRQRLVISRPQVLAAGHTDEWWDHKLDSGRRTGLGPGVAVAHSGKPEVEQLRWAAVLHGGRDAALTGDAALVHFGVKRLTVTSYDVAIPSERRMHHVVTEHLTVEPHRVKHLELWSAGHPHLRLVHVHAATLHAAAWAESDEEAEHRLTLVVQQRKTTPAAIRISLAQMPRLPRRALITEVLQDVELGAHAQSELDFLRFCRRNGLPEPDALQVKVRAGGTRYLDAYYRGRRLIIEVDGAHHRWARQWEADTMRSLQLAVATRGTGEQVVRLTRAMMRHHETETADLLRQLLLP